MISYRQSDLLNHFKKLNTDKMTIEIYLTQKDGQTVLQTRNHKIETMHPKQAHKLTQARNAIFEQAGFSSPASAFYRMPVNDDGIFKAIIDLDNICHMVSNADLYPHKKTNAKVVQTSSDTWQLTIFIADKVKK